MPHYKAHRTSTVHKMGAPVPAVALLLRLPPAEESGDLRAAAVEKLWRRSLLLGALSRREESRLRPLKAAAFSPYAAEQVRKQ